MIFDILLCAPPILAIYAVSKRNKALKKEEVARPGSGKQKFFQESYYRTLLLFHDSPEGGPEKRVENKRWVGQEKVSVAAP